MSEELKEDGIHPDALFSALLAKGGRPQRIYNLQKVHEICRRQHAQSKDLSIAAIGRICEAEGVLKGRVLYNAPSADYVSLISAWQKFHGVDRTKNKLKSEPSVGLDLLMRIEDPALRSVMQSIMVERDRLKAQINLLKAQSIVTVDRRPLGTSIAQSNHGTPVTILTIGAQLTDSEREALSQAISTTFLDDQGWREGGHGEIKANNGRTLFKVGYTRAIRKVLGS